MNLHRACRTLAAIAALLAAARVRGDGGVPIAASADGASARTLFMRPAQARVGPVEFTLLVGGEARCALALQGPSDAAPVVVPWRVDRATGVPTAFAEFTEAGAWHVRVVGETSVEPLEAAVQVADAQPSWHERLPWLLAWLPMVLVLAVRNRAVSYTEGRSRA